MTGVGVGYTFNSPSLQTSMLDKLEVDTRQGATINDRSSSGPNPIVLNVSIETDQDNMLTTVPNIQFNDHPIVSYPLGGKTVQYQFGSSDSVIDSFDPNWKVKLSDWNTPIPDNNLKPLLNIGFVGGVQTK